MSVEAFWALTPRETAAVFDAAVWRQERERERDIRLAWLTAALCRTKRMPSLKSLLNPGETKVLSPDEKARRRAEHEELIKRMGKRGK